LNSRCYDGPIDQLAGDLRDLLQAFTFDRNGQPEVSDQEIIVASAGKLQFRVLRGHDVKPWRVLVSPNAERLVSYADDSSIRLWDPANGKEISKFPGYGYGGNGNVRRGEFAAFSADGKWLATAFEDTVSFRRPADGETQIQWHPGNHTLWPEVIRFAPDGRSLFAFSRTTGWNGKALRFAQYRLGPPAVIEGEKRFESTRVAGDGVITPDSKYVITWYSGSPEVSIWNVGTRDEIAILHAAPNFVYDVALSPKGDIFATIGNDDEVKFWNVETHNQLPTKQKYLHKNCNFVSFSTDGKYIVTSSDDGWLKVWDAPEFCFVSQFCPSQELDP
jgi:WD40 repeat protein